MQATDELETTCNTAPAWFCEQVLKATDSETAASFTNDYLVNLLRAVLVVIIAMVLMRFLRWLIRSFGKKVFRRSLKRLSEIGGASAIHKKRIDQRSDTLVAVAQSIVTVLIWPLATLLVLSTLGVALGPLFAGAGLIGILIGFGAQSIVADFFNGFFMLFEDQFGVGDIVDVGEVTGTVEDVSLRTTTIRDVNGTLWHVRNAEVKRVANQSQLWARAVLDIPVAYDTDLRRAEGIIQRVADDLWADPAFSMTKIVDAPEVWGVQDLGVDAISIRLVVKTEPAEQFGVARELRLRIKEALEEAEIEIPFSQQTVWLRRPGSVKNRKAKPVVETSPVRTGSEYAEHTGMTQVIKFDTEPPGDITKK